MKQNHGLIILAPAVRQAVSVTLGLALLCCGCSALCPDRNALEEQRLEAEQRQNAEAMAMEHDPLAMSAYWTYMATMLGLMGYETAGGK